MAAKLPFQTNTTKPTNSSIPKFIMDGVLINERIKKHFEPFVHEYHIDMFLIVYKYVLNSNHKYGGIPVIDLAYLLNHNKHTYTDKTAKWVFECIQVLVEYSYLNIFIYNSEISPSGFILNTANLNFSDKKYYVFNNIIDLGENGKSTMNIIITEDEIVQI